MKHSADVILSHIHYGHHVHIGSHASLMASIAHIYIGNYVIFDSNVSIKGGNFIGKHIYEICENDKNVIIEDGVWVDYNVKILKGCHIGKGVVVVAGAIVTKDISPCAIVGGNPVKVFKFRFTED